MSNAEKMLTINRIEARVRLHNNLRDYNFNDIKMDK